MHERYDRFKFVFFSACGVGDIALAYHHLDLKFDGKIAILTIDFHGKSANVLSQDMLAQLAQAIDECEDRDGLTGLLLQSAKPSGFVFGADITEFEALASQDEVRDLQTHAMRLFDKIERSRLVSVAALHGPVLGGGLELALACDYRICLAGRIMAGFPEANLGLMPGFAGTARGARLLGGRKALELCLSAKPLASAQALQECGMVDAIVTPDEVAAQADALIARGKRQFGPFCDAAEWDAIITEAGDYHLKGRTQAHIPHLVAIVTHFKEAGADYDRLVAGELIHFPHLMMHPISANLRRVFALTDGLKKQARGASGIGHIHVIGAGAMGADIAQYLCMKGLTVTLTDVDEAALSRAYQNAETYFSRKLGEGKAEEALGRFIVGLAPKECALIDLVIEAAPEKMAVKQEIWQGIEASHRKDCLFATNSSALDLEEIAAGLERPHRLLGLHFFNPAGVMPLIEVIHRPSCVAGDVERLMQLALTIGKLPVKVQNSPGFLVNRALLPYIFEAIATMLDSQNSDEIADEIADEIDQALLSYGMPMGPLELADQIGLDICLDVGERLGMAERVKDYLNDKVAARQLGRKTGAGIYQWDGMKAVRARADYDAIAAQNLVAQMLKPMIQACRDSLSEGHISTPDMVDAAMIYGIGYPRHTGGPLHDHEA